ncbi:MAG: helix-turn-helix transcriptional regulator [Chloroflexota bacterium]
MTAITWDTDLLSLRGWSRSTTSGRTNASEAGWDGTTSGVAESGQNVTATGTALRSMVVGMLGSIDPAWPQAAAMYYQVLVEDMPGTGSTLILRRNPRGVVVANIDLLVPERVIAEIRATLGLNISETARALGVERPTVYAWLAGQVTPQRANMVRLGRVADIAASWRRRSSRPLGDLVRMPGADGMSIADLLSHDNLPDRDVQDRLDAASSRLSSGEPMRRRTTTSVHEAATRHGLKMGSSRGGGAEIDWLTRPSFGDEDD